MRFTLRITTQGGPVCRKRKSTELTADLKGDSGAPVPVPAKALVSVEVRERQTLIAVLGGTSRKGQWRPAQKLCLETRLVGESERDAERRLAGRSARRAALPPRSQRLFINLP